MPADRENIQQRIEREEFARGHLPEGADPVTPRPAATTVLVRPATDSPFEILLLKRPLTTRFAAGAYVFPGGVVDAADGSDFWSDRLPPMKNLPSAGRSAATAALRELFEETGILLSDSPVSVRAGRDPEELLYDARRTLLADESTFEDVARDLSLSFTRAPMTYFARWVTPRRLARRYDALFFLVALDDRAHEVTITDEHDAVLWIGADDALERFRIGELPMLFPTWKTIEELAGFDDLGRAVAELSTGAVETIEPFLDVHGNTVRPRMPDGR